MILSEMLTKSLFFTLCLSVIAIGSVGAADLKFIDYSHYAQFSSVAYSEREKVQSVVSRYGYQLEHYQRLPQLEVVYYVANNHKTKEQVIAVRGTANAENVVLDLAIRLIDDEKLGIPLHEGFSMAADGVFHALKPHLVTGYKVSITGHSLGGAIALILGLKLKDFGSQISEIITFGQPRVSNKVGAKQFEGLKVLRFVTGSDLVPQVPPVDITDLNLNTLFWHYGDEVLLLDGNEYSLLSDTESMIRSVSVLGKGFDEQSREQHSMALYLRRIEEMQQHSSQIPFKANRFVIRMVEKLL